MKVSKRFLLEFIGRARAHGRYPRGAERLLGKADFAFDLDGLDKRVATWPDDELVPLARVLPEPGDHEGDASYGYRLFFETLLFSGAAVTSANPVIGGRFDAFGKTVVAAGLVVDGDLTAHKGSFLIVGGSLDVVGDIRCDGVMAVAGGVRAGGTWRCENDDSVAIVCGDMILDQGVVARGETFVGGDVSAPFVHIANGSKKGFLKALGGLAARVAFEDDLPVPKSRAYGEVKADVLVPPALGGRTGQADEAAAVARLKQLVADPDKLDWASGLRGVLAQLSAGAWRGEQVLRGEALDLGAAV
ncbi:MAG: hypothetical protein KC635_08680 [Myxococcales bacterium]|nr:hypothetical protein [Myxococcales bacterium]MCB9736969.1 hypothetical protein [Deltaproteobacteria bacterium]